MNVNKLQDEFKRYNGGTLKFKDAKKRRTFYFELNYKQSKILFKLLKKDLVNFITLDSLGRFMFFDTLGEIVEYFNDGTIYNGQLLRTNDNIYGIADKTGIVELFENMMCPEKNEKEIIIETSSTYYESNTYVRPVSKKGKSIFTVNKPVKKTKFDWDEHYQEGKRIFGNRDEAEAYADEMKRKITGKI